MSIRLPTYFVSHGGGPWPIMKEQYGTTYDLLEASLADIPRQIDVSFRGDIEALEELELAAAEFGFQLLEWAIEEENGPWLYLERTQTTEPDAIKTLTITCLQIEHRFGVEYDGWGCVAQDGTTH